jgi:uncharacterized membrane protein YfcA
MPTYLSLVPPILYAIGVGGVAYLLVTRTSIVKHRTPSMVALGRLMAVGVPLLFIVNVILFKYTPGRVFTYICLGVQACIVYVVVYRSVKRIKDERNATRSEQE